MKRLLPIVDRDSRLIVLYLATVLIAGGILAYLSINNISNFQELTEMRILEEEKEIHSSYVGHFQKVLNGLTGQLEEAAGQQPAALIKNQGEVALPLVSDYLILGKDGTMIRPHFLVQESAPAQVENTAFMKWYSEGEYREFQRENNSAAASAYQMALEKARASCDSARAYTALTRLHRKLNQPERALAYHKILIEDFGLCANRFGIPYVYFSVDPLLRGEGGHPPSERMTLLISFLEQLIRNRIAFTNSTAGLLDAVSESGELKAEQGISGLIAAAREKAMHIEKYRPVLLEIREGSNASVAGSLDNFVVVPPEGGQKDLFLVYEKEDLLYGFVVPFEGLDQQARRLQETSSHDFGYELITRKRNVNPGQPNSSLEFEGTIHSAFQNEVLLVRPENRAEIDDFIFRRKLITYLGLTLLVGAMGIGLYMLVQDVNRKKRMARLRTDFVANVTHELKTPLTSINMFADSILLNRYQSEEDLKKYTRIILKEGEKLKRMVNNILEFSRQENDKVYYELKEENISEIIHQIMEEMDYWLSAHNFEVLLELDEGQYAMVDAEGLKQVLSNLITNAIKFSPEDKRLAIRAYQQGRRVCIDVEDHGVGIPEDQLESIFKKFYRIYDEPSVQSSGTGLGLTVSREIVQAMQGSLTVRSSGGKGSTFTITINSSTP